MLSYLVYYLALCENKIIPKIILVFTTLPNIKFIYFFYRYNVQVFNILLNIFNKILNNIKMECQAITKSGIQCSREAEQGSKYCWQHQSYSTTEINKNENLTTKYFQNTDLLQNTLLTYFSTEEELKNINKQFQNLNYEKYNTHIQPHGIKETYIPNTDILETKKTYVNGKLNGLYETYYYNSTQLKEKINYKDDKKEGLYKQWFDNGNLYIQSNYKNGEKNGLYEEWNYDGDLVKKRNYKNGKREGLYQQWYNNGIPETLSNYINDQLNGPRLDWHENGQLYEIGNYLDDKKNGVFKVYNEDGNLIDISHFENDIVIG